MKARKTSSSSSSTTAQWQMWLSLNPESDPTAIWLERKFDIPGSGGRWESETVFSIPVTLPTSASSSPTLAFPGIIVFECTPLEGVVDDLERSASIHFTFLSKIDVPTASIAFWMIAPDCVRLSKRCRSGVITSRPFWCSFGLPKKWRRLRILRSISRKWCGIPFCYYRQGQIKLI